MRTALLLLLLLAVAAVPGSVFPQRRINPGQVQQYLDDHPGYAALARPARLLRRLLVGLVLRDLPAAVRLAGRLRAAPQSRAPAGRAGRPPRAPRRLERLPGHLRVDGRRAAARRRSTRRARCAAPALPVARYDDPDAAALSVSAERGYLRETGNLRVPPGAARAARRPSPPARLFGYSGQVLVVEGQSFSNAVPYYDSFTAGSRVDTGSLAPFSLTLDRMRVRFDDQESDAGSSQFGAPRQFDADMTVVDAPGDAPVMSRSARTTRLTPAASAPSSSATATRRI